jgi:hypothetical protein
VCLPDDVVPRVVAFSDEARVGPLCFVAVIVGGDGHQDSRARFFGLVERRG